MEEGRSTIHFVVQFVNVTVKTNEGEETGLRRRHADVNTKSISSYSVKNCKRRKDGSNDFQQDGRRDLIAVEVGHEIARLVMQFLGMRVITQSHNFGRCNGECFWNRFNNDSIQKLR